MKGRCFDMSAVAQLLKKPFKTPWSPPAFGGRQGDKQKLSCDWLDKLHKTQTVHLVRTSLPQGGATAPPPTASGLCLQALRLWTAARHGCVSVTPCSATAGNRTQLHFCHQLHLTSFAAEGRTSCTGRAFYCTASTLWSKVVAK